MKLLKSTINNITQVINPPKRNKFLFVLLLIIGLAAVYIGFAIGGLLGIVLVLYGVGCIIAGFMQFIGICECICPNCNEKGYIYKNAKKYKCKKCKTESVVIEDGEQTDRQI